MNTKIKVLFTCYVLLWSCQALAEDVVVLKVFKLPFKIAGVGWVDLPMTGLGAVPTENRKIKIKVPSFVVSAAKDDPRRAELTWEFELENRSKADFPSVRIDEVSPTTFEISRVSDSAPAFHDKPWAASSVPIVVTRDLLPWLYADGPAYLVFRFTIQESGKKALVYLQPMAIWENSKKQLRDRVEKINGG